MLLSYVWRTSWTAWHSWVVYIAVRKISSFSKHSGSTRWIMFIFSKNQSFSLSYFHLSASHFIIFNSDSSDLNRQIDLKFVQAFSHSVIICILKLFIWALSNFLMWQLRAINFPQDYFYWFLYHRFWCVCFNFLLSLRFLKSSFVFFMDLMIF